MKKILTGVFTTLLLLAVTGYSVTIDTPMRGKGHGIITGITGGPTVLEITASGWGEATYLGRYTRTEQITLNMSTGAITGSIIFTAADGDELYCDFAGNFTTASTAVGTYYFTGGTGRFADASGEAGFTVEQSDPVNFTVVFNGAIEL